MTESESRSGAGLARAVLSDRDRAILDFEARWWQHPGLKEEAIRAELGISPARYYQVLAALADSVAALRYDPMLIKRLQRGRQARLAARERRASGDD